MKSNMNKISYNVPKGLQYFSAHDVSVHDADYASPSGKSGTGPAVEDDIELFEQSLIRRGIVQHLDFKRKMSAFKESQSVFMNS